MTDIAIPKDTDPDGITNIALYRECIKKLEQEYNIKQYKADVEAIIAHYRIGEPTICKLENCSRSKAYAIKREIDKQLNKEDKFCEVNYNKETKTACFDIVS